MLKQVIFFGPIQMSTLCNFFFLLFRSRFSPAFFFPPDVSLDGARQLIFRAAILASLENTGGIFKCTLRHHSDAKCRRSRPFSLGLFYALTSVRTLVLRI